MSKHLNSELRLEWLKKIEVIHKQFGFSSSPELIEQNLFLKSNNDANTYVNLIHNFFIGYKQQHQQQQQQIQIQQQQHIPGSGGQITSNYSPNVLGPSSSNADPLNALQNLTVSAGQVGQVVSQQNSTKMNPTIYNSQVRPRSSGPTNLHRPLEKYPTVPQSSSQTLVLGQVSHGQQSLLSSSGHSSNVAMTRLPNKSIIIKGEVGIPYNPVMSSLDSSASSLNSQQMFSQNIQRPPSNKLYQNSPLSQSLQIASVSSGSVNQTVDTSRPTTSVTSITKPSIFITEEETKKVSEEIKKLKEKYLKFLKLIIENHKRFPEEEMKIFRVLKNILENPEAISKPLSMKHVTKIELHLIKAEQLWLNRGTESGKCLPSSAFTLSTSNSSQTPSSRINLVPNNNESLRKLKYTRETGDENLKSRNASSLDLAFDEVCHQLMTTDPEVLKKVQTSLVKYVESKRYLYSHFLPKRLLSEESEDDDAKAATKRQRIDSIVDEDEFTYLDDLRIEKINDISKEVAKNCCNNNRDLSYKDNDDFNLEAEIKLLSRNFEIKTLDEEILSIEWCTYDTEWEESSFYSISCNVQTLPITVPPIKVRVPGDYQYCRYVDWNLNEELYPSDCGVFLEDIKKNLIDKFSKINQCVQWSGVSLSFVANIYKEIILAAKLNFQNEIQHAIKESNSPLI